MRITLKQVNEALKNAGVGAELVKGKDYFYFVSLNGSESPELWQNGTSVYVPKLNDLNIDEWVREAVVLKYSKN